MPEPPDSALPRPKPPLGKRVRVWAILILVYGAVACATLAAIPQFRDAYRPGAPEDRFLSLGWGILLLLPIGLFARYFIRLRIRTGQWQGTPEQRRQDRERRLAKCATRGAGVDGRAAGCVTGTTSWTSYALNWAGYAAMHPGGSPSQRVAAWAVMIAAVLGWLALVAFGVICFGAAFADGNSITATLLMCGLGLVILVLPVRSLLRLIRSIRAGKLGPTREELEEMRARRADRRVREYSKPLGQKILNTLVGLTLIGFTLLWHARRHPHDASGAWIDLLILAPALIYGIWIQFRKPKGVGARDSAPEADSRL